jgi:hypothetical protein
MTNLITALLTAALAVGPAAKATPVAIDQGLMVNVPGVGYSRVETVNFCLNEGGVEVYQQLLTDSDFANFEACLHEMT